MRLLAAQRLGVALGAAVLSPGFATTEATGASEGVGVTVLSVGPVSTRLATRALAADAEPDCAPFSIAATAANARRAVTAPTKTTLGRRVGMVLPGRTVSAQDATKVVSEMAADVHDLGLVPPLLGTGADR